MISHTDHLSGAGRLRNRSIGTPSINRLSFSAVAACTASGRSPSTYPRMRSVYCRGVSIMSSSGASITSRGAHVISDRPGLVLLFSFAHFARLDRCAAALKRRRNRYIRHVSRRLAVHGMLSKTHASIRDTNPSKSAIRVVVPCGTPGRGAIVPGPMAPAPRQRSLHRPSASRRIVVVAVPPVDELDLVGPLPVFNSVNRLAGRTIYTIEIATTGERLTVEGE